MNHRFYHVPASNTAVGHLVISNPVYGSKATSADAETDVPEAALAAEAATA